MPAHIHIDYFLEVDVLLLEKKLKYFILHVYQLDHRNFNLCTLYIFVQ